MGGKGEEEAGHRRWRRWLIEASLVVLVLGAIHLWQTRDLPVGRAPPLEGTLLDGRAVTLAQYRGKPLLVHFWATWCPVCRLEQGTIQALAQEWPVISVALQSGDAEEVRRFMVREGLSFPVLVDESGRLARRWKVSGVPVSFVLDGKGRIRHATVGYTTRAGLTLRLWLAALNPE